MNNARARNCDVVASLLSRDERLVLLTPGENDALSPYQITRDKVMTTEEIQRLMGLCEKKARADLVNGRKIWVVRHMLVHLAWASGLRAGELSALRIEHLNLAGEHPSLLVLHPDGDFREVFIGLGLAAHIRDFMHTRRTAWQEPIGPGSPLLPGRGGKPYTVPALCFSFRRAIEAARLPRRHSLRHARHSYSAFLLASTGNLRFVQRQMGHSSQSMTALYQDVAPEINAAMAGLLIS